MTDPHHLRRLSRRYGIEREGEIRATRYFEDHPLKRAPVTKYEGAVRKDQTE